jgi:tRNA/rRNA methyltransferase
LSDAPLQPAIILVEPQLAENIGSTARAMLNFGLTKLRIVNPRPSWPSDRAMEVSSGAGIVLQQAEVFRSLAEAVADLRVIYATSARPRDMVKEIVTPRRAAQELREHEAAGIKVGVIFGPERTGLLNEDIALADRVVTVPLNPDFSSLNLAQAVLLIAYEWHLAADDTPPHSFRYGDGAPAEKHHLMSFLTRLEAELDECGFLRQSHMRPTMVRNIRAMFGRASLTDQEVRTLHGILTELVTKRLKS